jgi:hypothetical protein
MLLSGQLFFPLFALKCFMGMRLIRKMLCSEIYKYQELLRKSAAQLEKLRGKWESAKNDLETERAMLSILKIQFEFVNENISLIVEARFMDVYRAGFEEYKRIFKEKHPEIDVSNVEVHNVPMAPEALKDLEDLKEQHRLSWSSFCKPTSFT